MRRTDGIAATVVAALLTACSHGEFWGPPDLAANPGGTLPARLTYNPSSDAAPQWLPDGSAIGFSWMDPARADHDRCLAFLAPDVGRIARQICVGGSSEQDTTGAVWAHGVSATGRLAFLAERSGRNRLAPAFRDLYVGRVDGTAFRRVLSFPYITPGGQLHDAAMDMVWPDDTTLVYLATSVLYIGGGAVLPDTVISTIEVVRLVLRGDSVAQVAAVPGTNSVSSVGLDRESGTLYATRNGSSRIFTLDLATGALTPAYDFAPLGVARDVQVAGGRIVAVIGGIGGFGPGAGGQILAVPLSGGTPALVADTAGGRVYRSLALEPSGRRVVAESLVGLGRATDLWMFEVP